jgi:hypothetical protein
MTIDAAADIDLSMDDGADDDNENPINEDLNLGLQVVLPPPIKK